MSQKSRGQFSRNLFKFMMVILTCGFTTQVGAQILQTLVSFTSTNGSFPYAGLTLGNGGNFYGLTQQGGSSGFGTIFKVTTNGVLTTLVSFANTNGANPNTLILGNDGNFYGTTATGGNTNLNSGYGAGTLFKVTTNGTLTTLLIFDATTGENPASPLTLDKDGNVYGMTRYGGITNAIFAGGMGTLFKVTTNGTFTMLAAFNGNNGASEYGAITMGNDGNLYGTTGYGGNTNLNSGAGFGTVFGLLFSPVITVQPQSQTNNTGTTVTFFVSSISYTPMSFQWQRDGTNLVDNGSISGATTSTLTLVGISESDAATYTVIVSNSHSSVISSIASLTVINPPVITIQPANLLVLMGTNVSFSVSLTGTAPFRYQWRFNGTNLLNATNAIYSITGVATNKAGNYSVVVTNAAGSAISSNAALTVVVSPKARTNYAISTATFITTSVGPISMNYQWQKNGTNLVNDANLSGTTNSTLTIASVSGADAATYRAIVSDGFNSVITSNAVLTVNNFPFIATQPKSQTVAAGGNATFNVTAYGAPPFVFQWYFNGVPVGSPTGGTNVSSYTLTNVETNQAGNYSVQVVNGYSSVTSSNALLTVFLPPRLALGLSAGYALLNLYGVLSNTFIVQYNTNLTETNWANLLSISNLPASPYLFLDSIPVTGERFYRAIQLTQ